MVAGGVEEAGYYHVVYEDDDEEDITAAELQLLLQQPLQDSSSVTNGRIQTGSEDGSSGKVDGRGDHRGGQGGLDSGEGEVRLPVAGERSEDMILTLEKRRAGGSAAGMWEEYLAVLRKFVAENGHPHVSSAHGLRPWVLTVRQDYVA